MAEKLSREALLYQQKYDLDIYQQPVSLNVDLSTR